MTAEERAFNYASTQKPTKLQVGEIAKHFNNGYQQAIKDFMEKAVRFLDEETVLADCKIEQFKNYIQNESEN